MRLSLVLGIAMVALIAGGLQSAAAGENWLNDPASSRKTQEDALRRIPFAKLKPLAAENIRGVVDRPSFFRRMPTQSFECDPEMFTFLVRYPEVLVNIWDIMDISKVSVKRISPFMFQGQDGAGTSCKCDLVYGNPDLHIYYGNGSYSGSMAPREITGRCVCVLHSKYAKGSGSTNNITGTMDVYLKLDNFGADLLTRTLGPFVGKTSDYNFVESAKFLSQINDVCENNPMAAQELALRLDKVEPSVRERFSRLAANISATSASTIDAATLIHRTISDKAVSTETSYETLEQLVEATSSRREPNLTDAEDGTSSQTSVIAPQKAQIYMRR